MIWVLYFIKLFSYMVRQDFPNKMRKTNLFSQFWLHTNLSVLWHSKVQLELPITTTPSFIFGYKDKNRLKKYWGENGQRILMMQNMTVSVLLPYVKGSFSGVFTTTHLQLSTTPSNLNYFCCFSYIQFPLVEM